MKMTKKKDPATDTPTPLSVKSTAVISPSLAKKYNKTPVGVTNTRSCHDIFFVILFIAFWIGMVVITVLSVQNGDLNRLLYGTDSIGNQCGAMNKAMPGVQQFDATDRPFLHYVNPLATDPVKLCVDQCPKQNNVVCLYGSTISSNLIVAQAQILNGTCFPALVNTENVMYRCVPTNVISMAAMDQNTTLIKVTNLVATDLNTTEVSAKVTQTLSDSWQVILGMSGVAVAVSFGWLLCLNVFSGWVVWITVFMANISSGAFTGYVWYNWNQVRTNGKVLLTGSAQIDSQLYNEKTLMIVGIISAIIFLFVFLISIAARKRIKLSIVIIQETSKALRTMPMIFIFPLFKYIMLVVLFGYFVVIFALLSSSGQVISQLASEQIKSRLQDRVQMVKIITPDKTLQFMQIYFVFGFLWTWSFILGVWQCTIAGSVASWYWSLDKTRLPKSPVLKAFWRCFRFHLGSIALGALLIAIVQVIRLTLLEAQRRLSKSGNKTAQYLLSCIQCCFCCVEKFIKFINKNAYIEIAVYGYGFCEAAQTAFQLLLRNAFRVVVVDRISNFLIFLGKILITALSLTASLYILTTRYIHLGGYYSVPLIFIGIFSWIIATTFASVVDMGIDTIFLCFCEDCERHDGSAEHPYYMSKKLKLFTEKHAKEPSKEQ